MSETKNSQSNLKNVPLFLVAGMPRGATTFLYHYLSQHPDIFLGFRKEINYFNVNYDRGLDWYRSLFDDFKNEKVAGDISPPCFLDDTSISKIKAYDGKIKLVLVIRDPVEWSVSFYHQFKSFDQNMPSMQEYFENGYLYEFGDGQAHIQFSGDWISSRIKEYRDSFGEDLFIYSFEYFKRDPLRILKSLEGFLGVSSYFTEHNFDNRRINESRRRNLTVLSWLLSRESVINMVGKLFPRNAVMRIRALFDKFSARTSGENSKENSYIDEELSIAAEYLSEERERVAEMFKDSPILFGTKSTNGADDDR